MVASRLPALLPALRPDHMNTNPTPPARTTPRIRVETWLDEADLRLLRAECERQGLTTVEAIRRAVRLWTSAQLDNDGDEAC
jgi:hypothetical protein